MFPNENDYQKLHDDVLITNQVEFATDVANGDYQSIADKYNLLKIPDFFVWKTSLLRREIYESTVVDSPPTQTTWNWATFQSQSVQQRESWVEMLHDGIINPSLSQVRANYNTIFGGQGASLQQQNFLLAISRRKARRIEALLTIGPGDGTASVPSILHYEGLCTYADVNHALTGAPL